MNTETGGERKQAEIEEGEGLDAVSSDLWSDDSSLDGDEETKARLEAEIASFNPREFWDVHDRNFQCIITQENARVQAGLVKGLKRKRTSDVNDRVVGASEKKIKTEDKKPSISDAGSMAVSPSSSPSRKPFNPYENDEMAYQLSESLEEFFTRLPPCNTTVEKGPWICIANPKARRRHTFDDIGGFKQEGFALLEEYADRKREVEEMNPGKPQGIITRKLKPHREHLESEIARIAISKNVTCGKWMLFTTPEDISAIWRVVATGTLEARLGCAAKVTTNDGNNDKPERLICVYTDDFTDKTEIERVLLEMKNLGLPVGGKDGRGIYYKCEAYTYLDIVRGNEYKLRASMYSSNDLFGETSKGRRRS